MSCSYFPLLGYCLHPFIDIVVPTSNKVRTKKKNVLKIFSSKLNCKKIAEQFRALVHVVHVSNVLNKAELCESQGKLSNHTINHISARWLRKNVKKYCILSDRNAITVHTQAFFKFWSILVRKFEKS